MYIQLILRLIASALAIGLALEFGPIVSFGDTKPFADGLGLSALVIALLGIIWATWLIDYFRQIAANRALQQGLRADDVAIADQDQRLNQSFKMAVEKLLSRRKVRWFSKQSTLHELPWFALIGPSGTGKTSLLRASGIHFPIAYGNDASMMKSTAGTRHCDWWFSDQAVFLDTAGRFSTQDREQSLDKAGWKKLLELLSKTRKQQPINGIIVLLSVQDLLSTQTNFDQTIEQIEARIYESATVLQLKLPVYVVLTKVDLLEGFVDTFCDLTLNQLEQVVGYTSEETSLNGNSNLLQNQFSDAWSTFMTAFEARTNQRLAEEEGLQARQRIYELRDKLAKVGERLQLFGLRVFREGSIIHSPPVWRGFYITSSTQEPHILERLQKSFSTPIGTNKENSRARVFFIKELLNDVIIREQGLVRDDRKHNLKQKIWLSITTILSITLLVAFSLKIWSLHITERYLIENVTDKANSIEESISISEGQIAPGALIKQLSAIARISDEETIGFGLSQNDKLQVASLISYEASVGHSLVPQIGRWLAERLKRALEHDDDSLYLHLKTYLEFIQPSPGDKELLINQIHQQWAKNFLLTTGADLQLDSELHIAKAIDLMHAKPSLYAGDEILIEQSRNHLKRKPLSSRIYKQLINSAPQGEINILLKTGDDLLSIFERSSQKPLTHGPKEVFTPTAWATHFLPAFSAETTNLWRESQWVMGTEHDKSELSAPVLQEVRNRYVADYIKEWNTFLLDLRLKKTNSLDENVEIARTLASPNSPLQRLIDAVSSYTSLGLGGENILSNIGGNNTQNLQRHLPKQPEERISLTFSPIHKLSTKNPNGPDNLKSTTQQVFALLSNIQMAKNGSTMAPSGDHIQTLLNQSALLPKPVSTFISELLKVSQKTSLQVTKAELANQLGPISQTCNKTITNRYPFYRTSQLDVLPNDFNRLFSPSGQLQQSFNQTLAGQVDRSGVVWKIKREASAGEQAAVRYFQYATQISDVMFSKPGSASMALNLTLVKASNPNETVYLKLNQKEYFFSIAYSPSNTIHWQLETGGHLEIRSTDDMSSKKISGPWAFFRLFDQSRIEPTERPEAILVTVNLEGGNFTFQVESDTAINPLTLAALRKFNCPKI